MTVGTGVRYLLIFERYLPATAPISVAIEPKITSMAMQPVRMLLSRHPIKRPGIDVAVKYGRTASASDTLT